MKIFEITYGRDRNCKGYVTAESYEQVQAYLGEIGWPMFSYVNQVRVKPLYSLAEDLKRLRTGGEQGCGGLLARAALSVTEG